MALRKSKNKNNNRRNLLKMKAGFFKLLEKVSKEKKQREKREKGRSGGKGREV